MNARFLIDTFLVAALFVSYCSKNPIENNFQTGALHETAELPDTAANQSVDTSAVLADTIEIAEAPADTLTVAGDSDNFENIDLSQLGSSYFPLHVGDTWHYDAIEMESDSMSVTITETQLIHGKTFYIRRKEQGGRISTVAYREENNVVYILSGDSERVSLDFNRPVGQKWKNVLGQETYIASNAELNEISVTPIPDNCIIIITESTKTKYIQVYLQGIGLASYSVQPSMGIGQGIALKEAIINGVRIKRPFY